MSDSCDATVRAHPPRPSDYKFGKEIGQGSFSTVYVAKEITTNIEYAIKVVDKQQVRRLNGVNTVMMERAVLTKTNHPFIIRLFCTFQDPTRLFYVLEYAKCGELLSYLNRLTSFDIPCTQFYCAEIFTALDYLHSISIIHRDLKPENVLLTENMHIKLADFGSAIILNSTVKPTSFTGTPEYISPEMLTSLSHCSDDSKETDESQVKDSTYSMDYWAFGCVIFQFISGYSPFRSKRATHEYEAFERVLNLSYSFPDGFDSTAKDLVQNLLVIKVPDRLGSVRRGGPQAIRDHAFFNGIQWDNLMHQEPPILSPNLEPLVPENWDSLSAEDSQKYHLSHQLSVTIGNLTNSERQQFLTIQEKQNQFHRFVRGRLIVKQGILFIRRGLIARKRMFILTEGPHLFYVDVESMVLKGEIDWSSSMILEFKTPYLFFIHVSGRTYYLEDPSSKASDWIEMIHQVKSVYFKKDDNIESLEQMSIGNS